MIDEKCMEVVDRYNQALRVNDLNSKLIHLTLMFPQMKKLLEEGRREKFMRWLGFVQGVMWCEGMYTLEELKDHNRLLSTVESSHE